LFKFIGSRIARREDPPLLTGAALFAGDRRPVGVCHLVVVRSPLPHATVRSVDLAAARRCPGVLAAWSAADLPAMGTLPAFPLGLVALRARPVLAAEEVRYTGEPLALVLAESAGGAADAAAQAELDLDPLPATADPEQGEPAATVERGFGDAAAAFSGAAVTVSARLRVARVTGGYLEPRASCAEPDGAGILLYTSTQWVFGVRDAVAAALSLEPAAVRVVAPFVGGGFGAKGFAYPEEVLAALAALRLGRPVSWVATRTEDMLSSAQSHGTILDLELAADGDGGLRGLRGRILHPIGAYAASGPGQADNIAMHLLSAYHLPAMQIAVDVVYTNTPPTGFIRGGGREVGNFGIERLLDRLADRLGLDRVEVRRRNLVPPEAMPHDTGYRSPRGSVVLDGGDYPALLEKTWAAIDGAGFRAREADEAGPALGLGLACFTESTGIGAPEHARLALTPAGDVTVYIGTTPHGQGHETAAAQLVAEGLGWPQEKIAVIAGDSSAVPFAMNTAGSRSTVEMGNAALKVAAAARQALLARGSEILEVAAEDLDVGPDGVAVRGVPDRIVALPDLIPDGLLLAEVYDPEQRRAYASGSVAVVVEVDVETGGVRLVRHVFVHDVGRPVNPLLLEGQAQGGAAHGLGYALFEEFQHDADGNPQSATFLDYSLVSAGETGEGPELGEIDTPAGSNPAGFRGAGEGATIPLPAAIASAVEDALRSRGHDVVIDELPITPDRVHRLVRAAAGHRSRELGEQP
jgi:aerobic carbon-monoxide dehydrogenase large subunit